MRRINMIASVVFCSLAAITLTSCAYKAPSAGSASNSKKYLGPTSTHTQNYASRLPSQIDTNGERVVVINPRVHAWGAYGSDGKLIKAGLATAGGGYCPDIKRACHTKVGTFRVQEMRGAGCKSSRYPLPHGGAPMPYCMFFNKNQAMHGASNSHVVEGNVSHGCVRMRTPDAAWLQGNFVQVGTKVIVKPY